ncbi:hypothetical protein [Thalassobaculum salexigens]|uniref:hypothetical protein n=1 Tax=Thalassobaculum salexigens TaxID=455360 RepID=UPI00048CB02B|nr:hypothetical protein [Thalassobaculum salexigens]
MTACRKETTPHPLPRLVADNPKAARLLMPLRDLERRLSVIDRGLARRGLSPSARTALRHQRALIAAILAARLTAPDRARRLEQELRWLAPRIPAPTPTPGSRVVRL